MSDMRLLVEHYQGLILLKDMLNRFIEEYGYMATPAEEAESLYDLRQLDKEHNHYFTMIVARESYCYRRALEIIANG